MSVTVGDLMTAVVVTAEVENTLGEVQAKLSSLAISALPVVDERGRAVGIVTDSDLVGQYPVTLPVSRVMTSPVEAVSPGSEVAEAARRMRERRHHHLVVVEDEQVVGILSSLDLLRLLEEL